MNRKDKNSNRLRNLQSKSNISIRQQNALMEIYSKYNQLSERQYNALGLVINLNPITVKMWFEMRKKKINDILRKHPSMKECKVQLEKLNPNLISKSNLVLSLQRQSSNASKNFGEACKSHLSEFFNDATQICSAPRFNFNLVASTENRTTVIRYDRSIDDNSDDDASL